MTADTVTARTAQLINGMYERLWDAPPPQHTRSQRNASDAVRAHAALHGWLPPLAWDDIDDDPDPNQPHTSNDDDDLDEIAIAGDTRGHLTYAEQIEVVRRMSERGRSIRTIADLLSTSKRTVSRHRRKRSAA